MVLNRLQTLLNDVYALEMSHDIYDFLTTDADLAQGLDHGGRHTDEKLLVAEGDAEASVSLYLDRTLVERLQDNDPSSRLDDDNLADFWTALEGISHFMYYAWNAAADKSVTLLEMELQAEVDKFVGTNLLLQRQGTRLSPNLHHCLFELTRFDSELSGEELKRYQDANHYAAKYCRKIAPMVDKCNRGRALNRELCEFYRYTQPAKIRHIEAA